MKQTNPPKSPTIQAEVNIVYDEVYKGDNDVAYA